MITDLEARRRDLGIFRALLVGVPIVAASWAPIIALLIWRAI